MHFCLFCCYLVNINNCCNDSFKWKKLVNEFLSVDSLKKENKAELLYVLKHLSLNRYVVFLLKCFQMVIISDHTCMCVFL